MKPCPECDGDGQRDLWDGGPKAGVDCETCGGTGRLRVFNLLDPVGSDPFRPKSQTLVPPWEDEEFVEALFLAHMRGDVRRLLRERLVGSE